MATYSETILDALMSRAGEWNYVDPVLHLDNGVLGGTMTYRWDFDQSLACLRGLLGEHGIDTSGLIAYFSIEEVTKQT